MEYCTILSTKTQVIYDSEPFRRKENCCALSVFTVGCIFLLRLVVPSSPPPPPPPHLLLLPLHYQQHTIQLCIGWILKPKFDLLTMLCMLTEKKWLLIFLMVIYYVSNHLSTASPEKMFGMCLNMCFKIYPRTPYETAWW